MSAQRVEAAAVRDGNQAESPVAAVQLRLAVLYTPLVLTGGGERQMLEEVRWLRKLGHEVAALTFERNDDGVYIDGFGRDEVEVLPARGKLGQIRALRRALGDLRVGLLLSHTSPELAWLTTRGTDVALVLYHNDPPFSPESGIYLGSRRYRRVLRATREAVAGYEEAERASAGRGGVASELRTLLKHLALRDARLVIVNSDRSARELRLLHGVEATVVRGCLDEAALEPPPHLDLAVELAPTGAPIVLSVSRLEPVKRVGLLIRAFARVRAAVPDALLIVVGRGSEREGLAALSRSLRLDSAVRFAGFVPDEALRQLYARADVFATPVLADFCITPYEALALGCRVVLTDEIEPDPAIDARGRIFTAPPEEEAFAAAILDALRSPPAPPLDLRFMTWESRSHKIAELCRRALVGGRAKGGGP